MTFINKIKTFFHNIVDWFNEDIIYEDEYGYEYNFIEDDYNTEFLVKSQSTSSSNNLSSAELERLVCLQEEMSEVSHIICKILRHGYDSVDPDNGISNLKLLVKELGDFEAVFDLLLESNDINYDDVFISRNDKFKRIIKYLHQNENIDLVNQIINKEKI